MNQKISVVIPVYNVERYLDRCLQSVVNQTYTNLQILLVDDGSTDGSGRLAEQWASRDAPHRRIAINPTAGSATPAITPCAMPKGNTGRLWTAMTSSGRR